LKETELTRLKYVAIDAGYLCDGSVIGHLEITALKRALKAMTGVKEMIFVCDITTERQDCFRVPVRQIKFYSDREAGEADGNWPTDVEELPDVQEEYREWKLTNAMRLKAVYGLRTV